MDETSNPYVAPCYKQVQQNWPLMVIFVYNPYIFV